VLHRRLISSPARNASWTTCKTSSDTGIILRTNRYMAACASVYVWLQFMDSGTGNLEKTPIRIPGDGQGSSARLPKSSLANSFHLRHTVEKTRERPFPRHLVHDC
jgi:hypothetical protein